MKRITQSFLLIILFASPVFCQESDSVVITSLPDTLIATGKPDSSHSGPLPDPFAGKGDSRPEFLQDDSASAPLSRRERRRADTLVVKELDPNHSSKKAIMYALVLPGLGQAYNGKFFKIPIVAAALGGVGYLIIDNTNNYRESVNNYIELPNEETQWYLEAWRRNMELSYIGLIVVYALQVLDAYVDAQLYNWDVNENLSLRIAPSLQPMMAPAGKTGTVYSLTCSFDLKRR